MPLGLACIRAVWWQRHLAASWGLVGGVGVVWVALFRCDWRRVGGLVLLGSVGRVSCGWRCAVVIGGEGVVWVALCSWDWWGSSFVRVVRRCDWWGGRRVGGAVPLLLVVSALRHRECIA